MLTITKSLFPGSGKETAPVYAYNLTNDARMSVTVITYGGIITDLHVPDREDRTESVVLGFDTLQEYQQNASLYFGALVGRISGRIGRSEFPLNEQTIQVPANEGVNHLHGNGEFSTAIWDATTELSDECASVILRYTSPDGANGFPGTVDTKVTYSLFQDNRLEIRYEAVSDQDTVLNLTNHTYFNLSGNLRNTIRDHRITADVTEFLELAEDNIPTGNLLPVEGTPFDLCAERPLDDGMVSDHPQNVLVRNGYDHPFVFRESGSHTITLREPISGRRLTLTTDYPCFVMYTGNYLDDSVSIHGIPAKPYFGVALEAQKFPDAPNHPDFPSITLKAGEPYLQTTTWAFDTLG